MELEYLSENPSITYDKPLLLVDSINVRVEELHCLGEDGGRVWTSDAGTRVRQVVVHRLSAVSAGEQRPGQD